MEWHVGQRIRNRPEDSWVRDGAWGDKLSRPREGVILSLPWAIRNVGHGTMFVEWDSLTDQKENLANWQMWIHSDFVEPA